MTDHLAATQDFYGRWARLFDRVATAPGVRSWRERTADALDLSPGDTVVEMGCGTGANFPHLRERVGPEGRVIGIDLVPAMLARARERTQREGWANVAVVQADATRPPIQGSVDAVLATFVVGMLPEPAAAVREWLDLLDPGGRIAVLNAGRSRHPLAAPLNLCFRGFVRFNNAGDRTTTDSPAAQLEARYRDAREAIEAETTDAAEERFGLGYVRLASGRRPPTE